MNYENKAGFKIERLIVRGFIAMAMVLGPIGLVLSVFSAIGGAEGATTWILFFAIAVGTGVIAAIGDIGLEFLIRTAQAAERTAKAIEKLASQQQVRNS